MKKGFTLIEVLVTLAVVITISIVGILNFSSTGSSALKDSVRQVGTALRQAQSDAMAQERGAGWGVHFDNTVQTKPFFTLFYTLTGTYDASSTQVYRNNLPFATCFSSSSVPVGSSSSVIFASVTGVPTASATITVLLMPTGCGNSTITSSSTITVSSAGAVSY